MGMCTIFWPNMIIFKSYQLYLIGTSKLHTLNCLIYVHKTSKNGRMWPYLDARFCIKRTRKKIDGKILKFPKFCCQIFFEFFFKNRVL